MQKNEAEDDSASCLTYYENLYHYRAKLIKKLMYYLIIFNQARILQKS